MFPNTFDVDPLFDAEPLPVSAPGCFGLCFPLPLPCVLMTWMVRCWTCACRFKFSTFLLVANDYCKVC